MCDWNQHSIRTDGRSANRRKMTKKEFLFIRRAYAMRCARIVALGLEFIIGLSDGFGQEQRGTRQQAATGVRWWWW